MEQQVELKDFLMKYGITEVPNDKKELISLLKTIIFKEKIELDYIDMKYEANKLYYTKEEYLKNIHNTQMNVLTAQYYLVNTKSNIKKERKNKFKQKVKSLFK